jgi:hypothetical protein
MMLDVIDKASYLSALIAVITFDGMFYKCIPGNEYN